MSEFALKVWKAVRQGLKVHKRRQSADADMGLFYVDAC